MGIRIKLFKSKKCLLHTVINELVAQILKYEKQKGTKLS